MVGSGRVAALCISSEKGVRKDRVSAATFITDWGIDGDAHAGKWHRQISLLALESIEKMRTLGLAEVGPGDFAENITTAGIDLLGLEVGNRIMVGACELEITQIGKECTERCAIFYQAGDCVMPREGIFARVIRGGVVHTHDLIRRAVNMHHRGGDWNRVLSTK